MNHAFRLEHPVHFGGISSAFGVLREERIRLEHFVRRYRNFGLSPLPSTGVVLMKKPEKNKKLSHHMPCTRYKNEQETYYVDCFGICSDPVRADQCSIDISERK
ncbi:MAG: hypothetical protein SOY75_06905 [Peptoniphilaceae bacterium]|nr:hypothetical protein [Peptoniphilaceae bacterium]